MKKIKIKKIQSEKEVYRILDQFNSVFVPPLQELVNDFKAYAKKIISKGQIFIAEDENKIIGFVSFYTNDDVNKTGFLSLIAVDPSVSIKGVGYELINHFEKCAFESGMESLKLEVSNGNSHAIEFYKRNAYEYYDNASESSSYMTKKIQGGN